MKINVEFDLTPDEFRRSLGLPDVEAFQQHLLDNIRQQMESGADGYDPLSLMKPFMQSPLMQQGVSQGMSQGMSQGVEKGLSSFAAYQQMMLDMLNQMTSGPHEASGGATVDQPSRSDEQAAGSPSAAASGQKGEGGSASSRSRRSDSPPGDKT